MKIKPGYRTSEFWFTLVSFIFSGLFLLGLIGENAQKEELITNVSHAVESCILIGGQLTILYKYLKGRTEVKKAYWGNVSGILAEPEKKEESSDGKRAVGSTSSNKRKPNKTGSGSRNNKQSKAKSGRSKKSSN